MVKEDDQDIYCGPVLTDFAKELVDKVEKRKKDADKVLTKKNTSVKKKNR
jgi:molybdenum-dependent DNA-binding transcriptional regulator ModE